MKFPQELQAARLRLVKDRPYLASAAWALRPVARPGLGTLGVDMYWRLYYDPAVTAVWSVEVLAGVLYHEISHLLRDHPGRMESFDPQAANLAADAEINDDLIDEGICLPEGAITPASIGQPEGLLAEEYYAALENQAQQSASDQGASAQEDGSNSDAAQDESASSADHGGDVSAASDPSSTAQGGGKADGDQPGDQGNSSGSKSGDSDSSQPGDDSRGDGGGDAACNPPSSSGQPSASPTQPGGTSEPSPDPGSGRDQGQDGGEHGDRAQTPAPGAGRCGSCATGQKEPWEDGPPSDGDGVSHAEGEMIRRDVARQITEHISAQGEAPGHWARWANEKLRPRINWRRELAAAVRHAVADVAGASDYSYARPSRRQGQIGNGKVVLPSLRRPVPSVAVVIDTSGSMSDAMLSQTLAEISGILKGLGQRDGITVLSVDAAVTTARKVFDARQVQLAGGGGTDMGEGIIAAAKLRPVPQVCIVLTDGYTPWPAQPPRGMKTVVVLVGDGSSPKWAKTITIKEVE